MRRIINILTIFSVLVSVLSCTEDWNEHFGELEPSVDVMLWDTISQMEEFSEYIHFIEQFQLDTVIKTNQSKTLFIPDNNAFTEYFKQDTTGFRETLMYHISTTYFMLRNVTGKRKLETLSKKYALIENRNNQYFFDDIEIFNPSPLYKNGKYYVMSEVSKPKPNLYEYIQINNPAIKKYIDQHDSIFLDREESQPIGFNSEGKTIYDSVYTVINLFEEEYFPISEEFRERSATFIIPTKPQYDQALDEMAQVLGGVFITHEDIPESWQNNVLIPVLLNRGIYEGILDPIEFEVKKKANIIGDSIKIDFQVDPVSRFICSNGITYEYLDFSIDDSLYYGEKILEMESLVDSIGANRYTWKEEVKVTGETGLQPRKQIAKGIASNDTVVDVPFGVNYQGSYAVEFKIRDVFPARYRFVWRGSYRTTGVFAIYINDELLKEIDTYDLSSSVFSEDPDIYKFWPEEGFNMFDFWIENIYEYGDVKVKIEYIEPGQGSDNGLNLDYVAIIPDV